MQADGTSLAIVFGIALVATGLIVGLNLRAERRLARWALDNGLTILKKSQPRFLRGPFTWSAARTDSVYRLTVRDSKGEVREGWARLSILKARNPVEARWEESSNRPEVL